MTTANEMTPAEREADKEKLMHMLQEKKQNRDAYLAQIPSVEQIQLALDAIKRIENNLGPKCNQTLAVLAHEAILEMQKPHEGRSVITVHDPAEFVVALFATLRTAVALDRIIMRNEKTTAPTCQEVLSLAAQSADILIEVATQPIASQNGEPTIQVKHIDTFRKMLTTTIAEFSDLRVNAITESQS